MPQATASENVKRHELHVKITRADGTVEDLGMISFYHKNPILRLLGLLRIAWQQRRRRFKTSV